MHLKIKSKKENWIWLFIEAIHEQYKYHIAILEKKQCISYDIKTGRI